MSGKLPCESDLVSGFDLRGEATETFTLELACYFFEAREETGGAVTLVIALSLDEEVKHMDGVAIQLQEVLREFPEMARNTAIMSAQCFEQDCTVDINTSLIKCYDVMRTTLTLDPDVAAMLAEYRTRNNLGLKETVNMVLRRGLQAAQNPAPKCELFSTRVVDHGRPNVPNVDDVGDLLEALDHELLR